MLILDAVAIVACSDHWHVVASSSAGCITGARHYRPHLMVGQYLIVSEGQRDDRLLDAFS